MVIQKKELALLLKPYYWVNILLTCSYVFCKKTDFFCNYIFAPTEKTCEFDAVSNCFIVFFFFLYITDQILFELPSF